MKPVSGILRIIIGLVVLGFGYRTYIKFAERFEQPDAKVFLGSTGIEVTGQMFLVFIGVAGAVGLLMILLGLLSFRSKQNPEENGS